MADTDDSTELAKHRTDWAEDRTLLANERTFAGWMRTGMACVALALGLRAVFRPFEPTWLPKLAATLLIIVALFVFWAAWKSARSTMERLQDHCAHGQASDRIGIITALLSISAALTGLILLFL